MSELKLYEIGTIIIEDYQVEDLMSILLKNNYVIQVENCKNDNCNRKLITIKEYIYNKEG